MVTIYEKESFQGKSKTLTSNWSEYYDYFYDKISSFKITSTGNGHYYNNNSRGERKYQITTETALDEYSGTDDNIHVQLIGTKGQSGWIELDNKGIDDRVKGNCDTFVFNSRDLGRIEFINIKISKSKDSNHQIDDWQFNFISVYDISKNKTYSVNKKQWLGDNNTSQSIVILKLF